MSNKEEIPWTWGDGGKPSQPNIHPIDSHAVGTRFLACGYDAEMKPFGVGDWVRYKDYARIKEDLEKSDGVVFNQAVENERLKAEVERLTKQNALATPRHLIASQDIKTLREQIDELKLENSQYEEHHKYGQNVITSLREEVERLTKAGDELWEFAKLADTNAHKARRKALKDWLAAKEGKSVK